MVSRSMRAHRKGPVCMYEYVTLVVQIFIACRRGALGMYYVMWSSIALKFWGLIPLSVVAMKAAAREGRGGNVNVVPFFSCKRYVQHETTSLLG